MGNKMKTSKFLAAGILICITYVTAIIVALHFLNPGYDPMRQTTSEYVNGHYGYLMPTAFFSMSLASLTLVMALYMAMPSHARSQTGLLLMMIFGVQAIVAMFFPVNLQGAPITPSGRVHHILGLVGFLCLTIGVILISRSFKKDRNLYSLYRPATVMSWIIMVMFFSVFLNLYAKSGFAGISQRILLVTLVTWFTLIAMRLINIGEKNRI